MSDEKNKLAEILLNGHGIKDSYTRNEVLDIMIECFNLGAKKMHEDVMSILNRDDKIKNLRRTTRRDY